jgi:hypothetical protein
MKSNLYVASLTCMALVACSPPGVIHRTSTLGDVHILAVDANQRLVIQGTTTDGDKVVCAEPSPDAVAAHAAQLAANASLQLKSGDQASSSLAAGYSQSVASIALRTQTIQVLRDGYFRLCEARLNNLIERQDYQIIVAFIDEFIATVAAIEAIGGTVQAAPIAIYAGGKAKAAKDNTEIDGAPSQQAQIPDLIVDSSKVDAERAAVIRDILVNYYARKAEFHERILGQVRRSHRTANK